MLNRENMLILDILSTEDYMTAAVLAEKAGCSSKTVRNRIKEINETLVQLPGFPAVVVSKPRFGFQLILGEGETKHSLYKVLNQEVRREIPATPGERTDYLLFFLLEQEEYVTISQLADQLYVTDSVVKTALRNTENILLKYGISLSRRAGYGIKAIGEEINIRDCLVDFFAESNYARKCHKNLPRKELDELGQKVWELLGKYQIRIPEIVFYNFVKYIYISIQRIKKGRGIRFCKDQQVQIDVSDIEVSVRLAELLHQRYGIELSEEEQDYFSILLAGKRVIGNNGEGNLVIPEELNALTEQMVESTLEEFNLNLKGNFDLLMILNQHMIPLDIRLRYNIPVTNPLLEDIQKNYPFAYTIAKRAAVILQEYYGTQVSADEIGYLAMIYALALEKQPENRKQSNILIVCSLGKASSNLLTYKYRQEFADYIGNIQVCNQMELKQVNFEEIDYVFTTVPIKMPIPVPVYEVGVFLNNEDITNVRSILEKGSNGFLKYYFREELFFTNVSAATREEAIGRLCELGRQVIDLPKDVEESVLYREQLSSTDYGNLVAIPHPYKTVVTDTTVIVGILEHPIVWGRNQVQVVFLFLIGSRQDRNLQKFYQETMRILMDEEAITDMIKNQSFEQFFNRI